jgi:molybdopterin synthase sulfur carrier subunit
MPVRFLIPTYLRPFTGESATVELRPAPETVGDALESLWELHPGVRDRVVTEQGQLRPHINVFVGDESIRFLKGFATPLPSDCEVSILPAVSGG